jgi:hypothetical protein
MITDMDNSTVGSSLEPDSASPTQNKPFTLTDHPLDSLSAPSGIKSLSETPSNLRHLTKHRAGLPQRRLPSRFRGEIETFKKHSVKRLRSESNSSNQVKDLFKPDDKPVTV